jgi:hypothetical protein
VVGLSDGSGPPSGDWPAQLAPHHTGARTQVHVAVAGVDADAVEHLGVLTGNGLGTLAAERRTRMAVPVK